MALYGTGAFSWGVPWGASIYARPITIMHWVNLNGGFENCTRLGSGSAWLGFYANISAGAIRAWDTDGSTVAFTDAGGLPVNAWGIVGIVSPAAGVIQPFTAYKGQVTVTSASNPLSATASWDKIITGALASTEMMAEFSVWTRALGTSEIGEMSLGVSPLSFGAPLHYWPLINDFRDLGVRRIGLQPQDTHASAWGPHPPVQLPRRRRVLFKPSAVVARPRRPFVTICA